MDLQTLRAQMQNREEWYRAQRKILPPIALSNSIAGISRTGASLGQGASLGRGEEDSGARLEAEGAILDRGVFFDDEVSAAPKKTASPPRLSTAESASAERAGVGRSAGDADEISPKSPGGAPRHAPANSSPQERGRYASDLQQNYIPTTNPLQNPLANPLEYYFHQHKKRVEGKRKEERFRQQFQTKMGASGEIGTSSPPERKVASSSPDSVLVSEHGDCVALLPDRARHHAPSTDADASPLEAQQSSPIEHCFPSTNVSVLSTSSAAVVGTNFPSSLAVPSTISTTGTTPPLAERTSSVAGKKRIHMTIPRSVISPTTPTQDAVLTHPVVWRVENFGKKVIEHPPGSCLYSPSYLFAGVLRFDFALYPRGGGRRLSSGSAGAVSSKKPRCGSKDSTASTAGNTSGVRRSGSSPKRPRARTAEDVGGFGSAGSSRKLSRENSLVSKASTPSTRGPGIMLHGGSSAPSSAQAGAGHHATSTAPAISRPGRPKSSPVSSKTTPSKTPSAADMTSLNPVSSLSSPAKRMTSSGPSASHRPRLVARCTCIGPTSPVLKELSFVPFLGQAKGTPQPFQKAREVSFQTEVAESALGPDGVLVCGLEIVRAVRGLVKVAPAG